MGKAEIRSSDSDALEIMIDYLKRRPVDAKAYRLVEEVTREKVAAIMPQMGLIASPSLPSRPWSAMKR